MLAIVCGKIYPLFLQITLTDLVLLGLMTAAIVYWLGERFFSSHPPVYKGSDPDFSPQSALKIGVSPLLKLASATEAEPQPAFLVFDTETVSMIPAHEKGLKPTHTPEAVALSWILLTEQGRVIKTQSFVILGTEPISTPAVEYHGITDKIRATKGLPPGDVYGKFLQDAQRASCWVAHSALFHREVVLQDLVRNKLPGASELQNKPLLCTMQMGGDYLAQRGKWNPEVRISLIALYGLLYLGRIHSHFLSSSKSLQDVTLAALCLAFLQREYKDTRTMNLH